MVAVQARRLVAEGKALMPGGGESMRVMSSDWRLDIVCKKRVLMGRFWGGNEDLPFGYTLGGSGCCAGGELCRFVGGRVAGGGVLGIFHCVVHSALVALAICDRLWLIAIGSLSNACGNGNDDEARGIERGCWKEVQRENSSGQVLTLLY